MHINEYKIFLSDSPQVTKIEIICRNTYIGSDLIGQKIAEITNINRPIREYRLAKYNLKKSVIPLYLLYFLSTFKEDQLRVSEIKMNLETACDCEDNCFIKDYLQIASTYELALEKLQMSGLIRIDGDQIELVNPSENLTENLKNEIGPIIGCI